MCVIVSNLRVLGVEQLILVFPKNMFKYAALKFIYQSKGLRVSAVDLYWRTSFKVHFQAVSATKVGGGAKWLVRFLLLVAA